MKKLYFLSLIIATAALFFGCKKDDNDPEPTPEPQPEPQPEQQIQYDSSEVRSFFSKNLSFNDEYHKPKSGSTDCRCFSNPISIAVNEKIYEPIEIKVLDTLSYTYRYQIANCSITDASGENMATDYNPNEGTYILNIPHKDLKPNTEYTVDVTIAIAQLTNGEWKPVETNLYTTKYSCKVKFTTGDLPENSIDAQDILYQYPIDRQLNYLTEEYKQGYIMLSYNYKNIFDNTSDADKKIVIKSISDADFTDKTINYTVTESHEVEKQEIEINYSLENVQFNKHQIYSLEFYCKDNVIYTMYFRTSKYPNAKAKFETFDWYDGKVYIDGGNREGQFANMGQRVDNMEFDKFEILSSKDISMKNSLITLLFDHNNCEWYQNSIYKLLYDTYPENIIFNTNQKRTYQYPPFDALSLSNGETYFAYLSDEDIENKNTEKQLSPTGSLWLYLDNEMGKDLSALIDLADHDSELYKRYMEYKSTDYTKGTYPYFISYRLPGKNIITYSEKHVLTVK